MAAADIQADGYVDVVVASRDGYPYVVRAAPSDPMACAHFSAEGARTENRLLASVAFGFEAELN